MSPGWQVICYGVAFVAFVLATLVALFLSAKVKLPWWQILVSAGLTFWVVVSLWNANAVYD